MNKKYKKFTLTAQLKEGGFFMALIEIPLSNTWGALSRDERIKLIREARQTEIQGRRQPIFEYKEDGTRAVIVCGRLNLGRLLEVFGPYAGKFAWIRHPRSYADTSHKRQPIFIKPSLRPSGETDEILKFSLPPGTGVSGNQTLDDQVLDALTGLGPTGDRLFHVLTSMSGAIREIIGEEPPLSDWLTITSTPEGEGELSLEPLQSIYPDLMCEIQGCLDQPGIDRTTRRDFRLIHLLGELEKRTSGSL